MRRFWSSAALALIVAFTAATVAQAEVPTGLFEVSGQSEDGATRSSLNVRSSSGWSYSITRKIEDGGSEISQGTWSGSGSASFGNWLFISFPIEGAGIIDSLDFDSEEDSITVWGLFSFPSEDSVEVTYYKSVNGGSFEYFGSESGSRAEEDDDEDDSEPSVDLALITPKDGERFLTGQVIELETNREGATFTVEGSAELLEGGKLRFTEAGAVTVRASFEGEEVTAEVDSIGCEVTRLEVINGITISDARPPHFQRALGSEEVERSEPAAILMDRPLEIKVTLQGESDLGAACPVQVEGTADGVKLFGNGEVTWLADGATVSVISEEHLNDKVAINELEISWTVTVLEAAPVGTDASFESEAEGHPVAAIGGPTELRVYTSYKDPVRNIQGRANVATKFHFEKACKWANEASQNIGNGDDSIGWNIDNRMRHFVHPKDFDGYEPPVRYYDADSEPPLNYDDLPGRWGISEGSRRVSRLYYPPLEPDEEYEEYKNYRYNFGWWLLDNPRYTGGRCNQQASLVCDIAGTLGIEGEVHYLQRTGITPSGRPARQYFYAAGGSGPWNFHGIARLEMADGSEWLYDGSFSSPPRRLNGERDWAESEGGPFIERWGPWYYEDVPYSEKVPEDDHPEPSTWEGVK